jgi:hypothetical protein
MLAQKTALESCESSSLAVTRNFVPNVFIFQRGLSGLNRNSPSSPSGLGALN